MPRGLLKNVQKIIKDIKNNQRVMMDKLSNILSILQISIINSIKKLKEIAIIERIGHNNGCYWKISGNSNAK
jgi:predicted HTH transcriptional regulator